MSDGVATFTFDNVVFNNGFDADGFNWYGNLQGMDGDYDQVSGNVDDGFNDGEIWGPGLVKARILTMAGHVVVADRDAMKRARHKLAKVLNDTVKLLGVLAITDPERHAFLQVLKSGDLKWNPIGSTLAELQFSLMAPKPYILSYAEHSQALTSSAVSVTNAGTWPAAAYVTIHGPTTNPIQIVNGTKTVRLNVALAGGETIIVDLSTHTVYRNGVRVHSFVASSTKWWKLAVGAQNISITGLSGGGTAALTFRDTWM